MRGRLTMLPGRRDSWASTISTVRDFAGSRVIKPRVSSVLRWFCTVEDELRPTARPISRTVGGYE
jgi:hypothetical protein